MFICRGSITFRIMSLSAKRKGFIHETLSCLSDAENMLSSVGMSFHVRMRELIETICSPLWHTLKSDCKILDALKQSPWFMNK